jgi:hypothetical protein
VKAKIVKTGVKGSWRASIRVRGTTQWRAWWPGGAGVPAEYSLIKRTVVRPR